MNHRQKKILRRTLMMTIALIFLVEAWLWDHMGAAIAALVRRLPFEAWRVRLTRLLERLSPWQTLSVFAIPVLVLLPFKFFALWLLAEGHVVFGLLSVLGAKLVGLGVTSFLFVLCKPKLLQLRWVSWLYHKCIHWRTRAHEILEPYMRILRRYARALKPSGHLGKLLSKLRLRAHAKR